MFIVFLFSDGEKDYRKTFITNAVVCGGMLAVMKAAWAILTRMPTASCSKPIWFPEASRMMVFGETVNWMMEEGL